MSSTHPIATALVAGFLAAGSALALSSEDAVADYRLLLESRYGAATAVPADGLSWSREEATWTLESGTIRLQSPTSDGTRTGLVFSGRGRFRMPIADPVELAQLRRVAERQDLEGIDEPITELVLRTSGGWLGDLITAPAGAEEVERTARKRHEGWLRWQFLDADARVVCGLLMPGDEYLRVDMKTESFGWLTYEFDNLRAEEVVLHRFHPETSFNEEWVSLDRRAERDGKGRPGRQRHDLFDLLHVDIDIDITTAGKDPRAGISDIHPRRVRFRADLRLVPKAGGTALPLTLYAGSKVMAVRGGDGTELRFLRDHIGSRSTALDKRLYDDSLVVLLERPLVIGEERRLVVEYEIDLLNYAFGRSWYPEAVAGDTLDLHTAELRITARKGDEVRAMGTLLETVEADKTTTQVYRIERPARMVTFSFAERFHEEKIQVDEAPEVIAFAATKGASVRNKAYNVAADVTNSLNYFQQLFATPLPTERIYVTSIVGWHGQSFDGFIHMAESSFDTESEGPTQFFRAHEVAHQWWGHLIVGASYRDAWLSEAFAEYSAMMFIEATMKKGPKYYHEIVESYTGQMLGVVKPSRFATWALEDNDRERARIGPISLGYRAATGTSPSGYVAQTYYKGALVLHMLRGLMRSVTKSDEDWIATLRDFLQTYQGKQASTADFIEVLSRHARYPGGWDWFFDQWVHGTAIPTYTWSYHTGKAGADGKVPLTITVEQSGVPEGFRMPVPVRIDLGQDRVAQILVMVDKPRVQSTVAIPAQPKKVELNPDGAVLARVRKKK